MRLAGTSQKALVATSMATAIKALITVAARDKRIDHHGITRPESFDGGSDFGNDGDAFVADDPGILNDLVADSAAFEIMDIRAADPDGLYLQQHVSRFIKNRLRNILEAQLLGRGQKYGFQFFMFSV